MAVPIEQLLLRALAKIDRPGSFCASGRLPAVLSGLEVSGIGAIAVPLNQQQAMSLKKQARQAPYGKGTKTLVDTDVRRVWEIDAKDVTLANPDWPAVVDQAVGILQKELGLEKQELESHLYKLLLYEPGSFFLPHQDGEKLDRMVATLVIALPSPHEGGELIVRHEGQEMVVDFGPDSRFHTQFAGFYADCEHEIRPVTSGFRLALVYNLTLAKSKQKITAPTSREHIAALAKILQQWKPTRRAADASADEDHHPPSKLAVVLDHDYTQAGLRFDVLKGVDRVKASVLFDAARESGCDAYLALVTKWESGSGASSGGYDHGRYDRYSQGDDDDEYEYEMIEVYDESLTAEHFSDVNGHHVSFGKIPLNEAELVSAEPLTDSEPDKEDFEGFTGNAGMTLERWYHRAAVILWPAETRFDILFEAGIESAVGGLERMVQQWKESGKHVREELKTQCVQLASRIIDHWPAVEYADYRSRRQQDEPESFLPLLEKLGDSSLISRWFREVFAKDMTIRPASELGNICKLHGWRTFETELREQFARTDNETIERHARILADFSLRKDRNADRRRLCLELGREMIAALESWDAHTARRDWRASKVERSELLPPLVQSFIALDQEELLGRLVDHVLGLPDKYDFTTIQIPAMLSMQPWLDRRVKQPCRPLEQWLRAVHRELETRAANPPRPPADWKREATSSCQCANCKELIRFLEDPCRETLRLPLAKERRQHLHQIIDGNRLDLTHVTERRGRPYTLVCTKTNDSHERALEAHHLDLDHLKKIGRLLERHQNPQTES